MNIRSEFYDNDNIMEYGEDEDTQILENTMFMEAFNKNAKELAEERTQRLSIREEEMDEETKKKYTEAMIKLHRKKKINEKNCFDVKFLKISDNLKKDIDTTEDNSWRSSINLLECNSKIYDLRTNKFKNVLDNVIHETEKEALSYFKPKKLDIIDEDEEFDRKFYEGKDTLVAKESDIMMSQIDLGFEKDPLISYISSKFSGSGSAHSFFHNLEVKNIFLTKNFRWKNL